MDEPGGEFLGGFVGFFIGAFIAAAIFAEKASTELAFPIIGGGMLLGTFLGAGTVKVVKWWMWGNTRTKKRCMSKVIRTPGISHTRLCESIKGSRDVAESAIRELLTEGRLTCEQKGRVRRYFVQQPLQPINHRST